MNYPSTPHQPFSSAYLEHLSLLAQETKDRMKGVPPFYVLLVMALIAHLTILVPVYFLILHEDIPITQQIRLTFGNGKAATRTTEREDKASTPAQLTHKIDTILDRPERENAQPVPIKKASTSTTTATAPTIPSPVAPNLRRRESEEPQTLRGSTNRYADSSSIIRRPSAQGTATRGGVAARGVIREGLNAETQTIITKYEALLSGWIHSHQQREQYGIPSGTTARVIVRLRINRQGFVQFKVVERTSGYGDFDQAALETVQRSSPVPAVPVEYPGGDQVEFLIPMSVTIE
jgi:TonB family protein